MTNVHHEEDIESGGQERREDAKQRMGQLPAHYKLDDIRSRLQQEREWEENGRNQFALFHSGALRVGLFAFKTGTGIEDHKVNGHVAVHVLQGRLEVSGGGRSPMTLGANEFIGLDGMKTFTIRAHEESVAVITFDQADGVAEPARGNDQGTQISK